MDHAFVASFTDVTKCAKCTFTEDKHRDDAVCDSCPNTGKLNPLGDLALCRECLDKEMQTIREHQSPEKQEQRMEIHNHVVEMSRNYDASIRVATDLFNANTTAIVDLKKAIDDDANIPADQKNFKLAEVLMERFNKHKAVIFQLQQSIVAEGSSQRAIQVYLNNLANKLQAEEREKLKIADINYKPEVVKEIKPKVTKPKVAKATKAEIKEAATLLGIGEYMVVMTMTAKGCDLQEAVRILAQAKIDAANAATKSGAN